MQSCRSRPCGRKLRKQVWSTQLQWMKRLASSLGYRCSCRSPRGRVGGFRKQALCASVGPARAEQWRDSVAPCLASIQIC